MSVIEHGPVGTQKTTAQQCFEHRYEMYCDMGFTTREAETLANAKAYATTVKNGRTLTWSAPLHHGKVRKALEAGCSHRLAVRIFS